MSRVQKSLNLSEEGFAGLEAVAKEVGCRGWHELVRRIGEGKLRVVGAGDREVAQNLAEVVAEGIRGAGGGAITKPEQVGGGKTVDKWAATPKVFGKT